MFGLRLRFLRAEAGEDGNVGAGGQGPTLAAPLGGEGQDQSSQSC
jgi:hypothetical protein